MSEAVNKHLSAFYHKITEPVHKEKIITHKRAILCGNVIEVIEYEQPLWYGFQDDKKIGKKGGKVAGATKETRNITQSVHALRRLINTNCAEDLNSHGMPCFLTLTYSENMTDIKKGKDDFKNFVKRWNYQRKKQKLQALKYVYVVEFQKRGAVHFHVIFFDLEFTPIKDIAKYWGHGGVWINAIEEVDNVGSYVVKYMGKAVEDERMVSVDLYGRSRGNLAEPQIIKKEEGAEILLQMYKKNMVYESKPYESKYNGKIVYRQMVVKQNKEFRDKIKKNV